MSDIESYQRYLFEKEKEWESRCTRCGTCCGGREDPCEHLRLTSSGNYLCGIYEQRLGKVRAVSGREFTCVPIREKLARGESWPGDERCGYKSQAEKKGT